LGTSRTNLGAVLLAHTNTNLRTVKTQVNIYANQKINVYGPLFGNKRFFFDFETKHRYRQQAQGTI
jgi:hypothetical protein